MTGGRLLKAAIFDVDGLLIDSEPIWRRTEVEVFAAHGVALTEEMCEETTGLRIDEVAAHWLASAGQSAARAGEIAEEIVDRMVARVRAEGRALDGGAAAIECCAAAGLAVAVASSSPGRLIDAAIERLGLASLLDTRVSAQHEQFGKPHPAVILTCAARLGVAPTECVVFEDSLNGVIAAKAARALCVAVPSRSEADDPRFAIADRVLRSLVQVDEAFLGDLHS
ncbi:MAG TPA: hexitol phosphatase HxpB [Candidatus Acidoferrum sp.]|nr:hexitol phosphatase HxpB [Candidatus Acidoferrum sp.]